MSELLLVTVFVLVLIIGALVVRRVRAARSHGSPQVSRPPSSTRLSAVLSVVGGPEGRGLEARLTNVGDRPITIEAVYLSLGRRARSDGLPSGQWRIAGFAMDHPFVVDAPRTLAPAQDTVFILPHSSAHSLHLLAEYINEDVAIRVAGPEGEVATLDNDMIRTTVAQLMEEQNPAVRIRLKRQVTLPKRDSGTDENSAGECHVS